MACHSWYRRRLWSRLSCWRCNSWSRGVIYYSESLEKMYCGSLSVTVLLYFSSLIHPTPELSFSCTLYSSWVEIRLLTVGIHSVYTLHHRLHPCHWAAYKLSWQMVLVCIGNTAFQVFIMEFKANDIFSQGLFLLTVFSSICFLKKINLQYLWNFVWFLRKLVWPLSHFCVVFLAFSFSWWTIFLFSFKIHLCFGLH